MAPTPDIATMIAAVSMATEGATPEVAASVSTAVASSTGADVSYPASAPYDLAPSAPLWAGGPRLPRHGSRRGSNHALDGPGSDRKSEMGQTEPSATRWCERLVLAHPALLGVASDGAGGWKADPGAWPRGRVLRAHCGRSRPLRRHPNADVHKNEEIAVREWVTAFGSAQN